MTWPASPDNLPTVSSGSTITSAGWNSIVNATNQCQSTLGNNPTRNVAEGRLTLTTGVPITTSDVTGATTVYYTGAGCRIALYDGTSVWNLYLLSADLSLALGTLANNTLYDVFCYSNAGTPALELGPAWTNDTTRSTGLVLQDGIWVKSGATTRRYLGTLRTTSTTTTEDSAAKRYLWNMYNRVPRLLQVVDATASWTYSTATWRQANASSANQVGVVVGLAGAMLQLEVNAVRSNTSAALGASSIGIGSTSAAGSGVIQVANANAANSNATSCARLQTYQPVGYQYYAWLEIGSATGTDTWYGTSGNIVSGLSGYVL